MRRPLFMLTPVGIALAFSGCMNPELEARQWDEIQTLQTTVTELTTYTNDLNAALDSLRRVTAKQDTALRLLTDFTGAIVPGYRAQ